jgi:transcriptional regulator with XRE-family HTH domain
MNIKEKFGLRIRNLREQKKYSIEHLANISDVDRNYLSAIEKGKRNCSLEIQEKLISGLEMEFADFFNDPVFEK